ncbi:MAG: hypothetical protein COX80_01040 [Candidatus Magasanikbacteria bacterium CG_4_10_14_0_2_um_filter_33_14]|uniref:Uncharacterized protein n=1 Tax=Candidatus Magasanikbacteria bacterium CG_4_10_14_0_2_um_filter_33_14 TaxID=1974636 RepID=A0A2M7VBN1_9BACT|nr:MAG: hypothetical protein COX80_01040 [Candidatus Magasanikbacteria bacterium CG_4_10_14_0_2_um_filter_33_14]
MPKKKSKKTKKKEIQVIKKKTTKKIKTPSFFTKKRLGFYALVTTIAVIEIVSILFFLRYKPETLEIPDIRSEKINNYFTKYNMPLSGYGDTFVKVADDCDMDWRLLPAIAVRESSGGKHMQLNNPFGWGGANIKFDSIEDAIYALGSNLCGDDPDTAKWYNTTSTYTKLYRYNGTVVKTYPAEVMWIMEQF